MHNGSFPSSAIECALLSKFKSNETLWRFESGPKMCHLGTFSKLVTARAADASTQLVRPSGIILLGMLMGLRLIALFRSLKIIPLPETFSGSGKLRDQTEAQ